MEVLNFRQVKDIFIKLGNKSTQIKEKNIYLEAKDLNLNPQIVFKIIARLKTGEKFMNQEKAFIFFRKLITKTSYEKYKEI